MEKSKFELSEQDEYIELYKLLKAENLVESGGLAKNLIAEGYVKVDGEIETQKRKKIRRGMVVEFENDIIEVV